MDMGLTYSRYLYIMVTYRTTNERKKRMSKAQLAQYMVEINEALVSVLDDDYPDTIDATIVEIMERDGLSDEQGEMIRDAM